MTARDVILAYLKEKEIPPGSKISRDKIVDWCLAHQSRLGEDWDTNTYSSQIDKMIFRSAKNSKEGHSEGLDNVFCPSSLGETFVVTVYEPRC